MMDHRVKAKELLEEIKKINSGDTELNLKLQKQLEKLSKISDESYYKNDLKNLINWNNYAEIIINATYFIANNGTLTFDSEIMSVPKGKYISVFMKHMGSFSDEEYWENLTYAYMNQDFSHVSYDVYKMIFSSKRSNKEKLMSDEDIKFLKNLPDTIKIYRGGAKKEKSKGYGISWTLNKDIAQQFVDRKKVLVSDDLEVLEITIHKSKVVAYLNQRNEEEIIYLGD